MNVIVSNRQKEIIDNANIDAIKDLNGLFNVDDLINKFKNYFFSKMILDATSVVNFASREVLTTLVNEIGAEKLIILLPSDPEPPLEFKKLLIELKIYNFTNKIDDVLKFIENPNTYDDVIKTIDSSFDNNMYVDNSIKEDSNVNIEDGNSYSNTNNEEDSYNTDDESQHSSLGDILSNFNLQNSNEEEPVSSDVDSGDNTDSVSNTNSESEINYSVDNSDVKSTEEVSNNIYTSDTNEEVNIPENTGKNTFLISDSIDDNSYAEKKVDKVIIGFKNVTLHAGSTSLIYMLHRVATATLKKNVLSIEIDKKDFKIYRDNKMISVENKDVLNIINDSNEELILVDLNNFEDTSFCTDVIYLVEPSTIKLNKLMIEDKDVFKKLKNDKVVINQSLLSNSDIRTLSSEAGMEFFDIIEPLNDRILNDSISKFLSLLNIN